MNGFQYLVIRNGRLARSVYAVVLYEAVYGYGHGYVDGGEGEAVFTDSGGRTHTLG